MLKYANAKVFDYFLSINITIMAINLFNSLLTFRYNALLTTC